MTFGLQTDMKNVTNIDPSTQKSKMFALKDIMFELKKYRTEELCLTALNIDAKIEGQLTCAFKNDMRNLATLHRLKNSDFI